MKIHKYQSSTINTPSQSTKGLLWGCHRIDTNAVRLEFETGHIRGLRVGKYPLDLRRVVRRHLAQADVGPRHVGR